MSDPSEVDENAVYVAGRVSDVPSPPRPSVTRRCTRCNARVWIEEDRLSLALACGEIVCVPCIGSEPRTRGLPPLKGGGR
jgi:hypothetical protein